MNIHQPYHEIFNRDSDFQVKYDFLPLGNGPFRLVYQGSRFDFRYLNNGEFKNSHYMIWPEFEDPNGFLILDKQLPIQPSGTARMWILSKDLIKYHHIHLKIGMKGYLTNGSEDIAICKVIKVNNF